MIADEERHSLGELDKKFLNRKKVGRVGIKISDSFAKTRQGQILLWAASNLVCRLSGHIKEITIVVPKDIEYAHPNYIPYNDSDSKILQEVLSENVSKARRGMDVIFKDDDFDDGLDAIILIGSDCSTNAACSFIKKIMAVRWLAFVGDEEDFKEIPMTDDTNPFGALVAGCLGTGEIFKYLGNMADDAGSYLTDFCFSSYDFLCHDIKTGYKKEFLEKSNPRIPDNIYLEELVVAGCGAVGHAFGQSIYSLERVQAALTVIDRDVNDHGDSENIESTNLARYILANNNDLDKPKAKTLSERLGTKKGLDVDYSDQDFHEWSGTHDKKIQHIVSCVDNNRARHAIQEQLAKNLHGGSSDGLRSQISMYDMSANIQCLKCSNPISEISDEKLLEKLSKMSDSERLEQCKILELDHEKITAMISDPKCGTLDMGALKKFPGLWQGKEFSVNFVTALSGILLASEIIKINVDGFQPILNGKPYSDIFFSFWNGKSTLSISKSEPKCWCNFGKPTPRAIYAKKWNNR